jgi:hypothetical protein
MALSSRPLPPSLTLGDGETNVRWYVVFKEKSKTLIQTADDKDDALSVACGLYLQVSRSSASAPWIVATKKLREPNYRTYFVSW